MALPALAPEDEEEVAGAGPGVAPLAPVSAPAGFPAMPGVPPAAPAPAGPGLDPNAPPLGAVPPDPNANLPPDALMQPGTDLQPPAPAAPPPIPLTPDGKVDIAAAEKNALGEQGQLQAQGEGAEHAKGAAETKIADAESTAADKAAELAAQHAIDQQKVVDTANANTQKWLDQAQQDAQKYRGMGLHDYWQDKSTGDKVLAGLSMLFGAAGKTQGGPENNPGMGMIERAVERDFRRQQADIEKARSNLAVDKEQYDLGMTAKQQALADSNLKKANAYDAAAAQLVSYKLKQGVPLAQANTDANVVALRQKGLATRQETLQAIHAQNVADAHLDIERQRADAMTLRAQKYKMRGAGGAGGGGGLDAKAVQFSQWAEQNPKASESQREAMAVKLGIPLQAKAGHTSLKTIEDRISANSKVGGAGDEAKRTITLDDGSKLALPSSKAVPQFVNGYNSRVQAKEKLQALLKDVQANGNVWSADNAARRQALIHDANIAVGSISSMGSSDHSTHLELGTLGPVEPRKNPIWGASNDVGIKLLEDKIRQIDEGTNRTIHSYRNNGEALAAAEGEGAAPAPAGPGARGAPKSDRELAHSVKAKLDAKTPGGGIAEGSTSTSAKGIPIVYRGGKWIRQ